MCVCMRVIRRVHVDDNIIEVRYILVYDHSHLQIFKDFACIAADTCDCFCKLANNIISIVLVRGEYMQMYNGMRGILFRRAGIVLIII